MDLVFLRFFTAYLSFVVHSEILLKLFCAEPFDQRLHFLSEWVHQISYLILRKTLDNSSGRKTRNVFFKRKSSIAQKMFNSQTFHLPKWLASEKWGYSFQVNRVKCLTLNAKSICTNLLHFLYIYTFHTMFCSGDYEIHYPTPYEYCVIALFLFFNWQQSAACKQLADLRKGPEGILNIHILNI